MDALLTFIKTFIEVLFSPLWWMIVIPISVAILRKFIDKKTAKRNAKIEYENQKQAYKDAIKELENEKRES